MSEEDSHVDEPIIQSYVLEQWYVSTIRRRSSASLGPRMFHETLVWEWDKKTRERGNIVGQSGASDYLAAALGNHARVCLEMAISGKLSEDNE